MSLSSCRIRRLYRPAHFSSSLPTKPGGTLFRSRQATAEKRWMAIRRTWQVLCTLAMVLGIYTRKAVAATTSTASIAAQTKKWIRPLFGAVFLWIATTSLIKTILVRRRQAVDATSEWGRYAAHPAARGRAVMNLCVKLLPFLVAHKLLWFSQSKKKSIRIASGEMFAESLLRLGPLYIKLGQIVSCREKLLPEEWKKELERLQDQVPSKSGQEALDLAYGAAGSKEKFNELFSDFDTKPLAAASLGQVHKAVLRDTDETVAVKLQRSHLREIYDQDLALMHKIAKFIDKMGGRRAQVGGVEQSWNEIFTDAEVILYREIDYRDEAANTVRFIQDFGIGKNGTATKVKAKSRDNETLPSAAPWLRAPYVYDKLSSEKLLIMEFVPSIKITNNDKLDAANVTAEDKEYLADCLARSYLRQFCANCFFSTDPHPGNLGVEVFEKKSKPPRLVFYDFGQATSLSFNQSDGILDVIEATIDMDSSRCVTAFEKMGVLKENADLEKVREKVQNNFETGKVKVKRKKLKKRGYKLKELNLTRTTANTTKESDAEVMSFFKLPAEYAFVARAISQMDGVGKGLDPEFDFISSAAPYLVEVKGAKRYLKDEWQKIVSRVQGQTLELEKKLGIYKPIKKKRA